MNRRILSHQISPVLDLAGWYAIEFVLDQEKSMRTTIFFSDLIDATILDENTDNAKVYSHVNSVQEILNITTRNKKINYGIDEKKSKDIDWPGSRYDRMWNEISKGSCANGSEQSLGQPRCQLSVIRSDKRCHCWLLQEF